jgi:hypothetical protein
VSKHLRASHHYQAVMLDGEPGLLMPNRDWIKHAAALFYRIGISLCSQWLKVLDLVDQVRVVIAHVRA